MRKERFNILLLSQAIPERGDNFATSRVFLFFFPLCFYHCLLLFLSSFMFASFLPFS